ncbi:MAG: hypothetical protein FWH04_08815 [Oscillospiraceae bacterium]|nr:hypothetical protein [Oscillospiraceae bacterium]
MNINPTYQTNHTYPASKNPAAQTNTEASFADVLAAQKAAQTAVANNVTPGSQVKSIYDIPENELNGVLYQVSQACSAINTAGLTKGEIYNRIEAVFVEHFGKDFMEPNILHCLTERTPYMDIPWEFNRELRKHGIDTSCDSVVLMEARGYSGMSEAEIRAAVRSQYPETMTLRECMVMARELWALGLDKHNYANTTKTRISSSFPVEAREETQKLYEAMLDKPANYESMKASYHAFAADNFTVRDGSFTLSSFFSELLSWFGGDMLYNQDWQDKVFEMLKEIYEKHGTPPFITGEE